ncbi:MAG: TetR/AcrR family transcriptional regulator [Mycobacterium sp.]
MPQPSRLSLEVSGVPVPSDVAAAPPGPTTGSFMSDVDPHVPDVEGRPPTTRELIVEAAFDLFLKGGVAGTAITDIERAAGLAAGSGAFYRHFRSKEEVLVAAVERGIAEKADALADRIAAKEIDDPVERRTREYELVLAAMQRFDQLGRLVMAERERFPQLEQALLDAVGTHWGFEWSDDPTVAIATAALRGYYEFTLLGVGPYRSIAPADFIAALAKLTT